MTVPERLALVRGMFYATSSSEYNLLSANSAKRLNELKRRRNRHSAIRIDEAVDQRSTIVYAVKSRKVLRAAFSNFMGLNEQNIACQAKRIATASCS